MGWRGDEIRLRCLRGSIAHLGIAVVRRGAARPNPLIIFAILHRLSYIDHPTVLLNFSLASQYTARPRGGGLPRPRSSPMCHPERSDATQIDPNERIRKEKYTGCSARKNLASMIKANCQRNLRYSAFYTIAKNLI